LTDKRQTVVPSVPGWQEAGKWIPAGQAVYQAMERAEAAGLTSNTHYILVTNPRHVNTIRDSEK